MKQKNNLITVKISLEKTTPKSIELQFSKLEKKFKQRPQLSSRFFRSYKNLLLKKRLIVQLQGSNKRTKYYSITPLGICFFVKNNGYGLHGKLVEKTLKILNAFYHESTPKIFNVKKKFNFENMINRLSNKKPDHNIGKIINNFLYHKIEYSESPLEKDSYNIAVRYSISFNLENIIARFALRNNEIKFYQNLIVPEGLLVTDYLTEKDFHIYLSTFLLYGICYYRIKIHFENFVSSRKFTKIDDLKFSDYDYELDKIKKFDKDSLKLVILMNDYFLKLLGDDDEIKTQLEFFQNKMHEYDGGEKPVKRIYKNDPNSWLYQETTFDD